MGDKRVRVLFRHCEERSDEAIQFRHPPLRSGGNLLMGWFLDCFATLAMTLLALSTAFASDDLQILTSNVDNIHWVAPGIFRSGQPNKLDMQELERLGMRSVLNLRALYDDCDEAEGTALTLYDVPMRAALIHDEKIKEALTIIRDAPKPLLIHCLHGSDRTGVVVAMYRIVFHGWDREVAVSELMQDEYGHHSYIFRNIRKYIREVDIEKVRPEALLSK